MADNEQFADYLGQLQEAQFPRWTDLPQFDLYMDQVIQYVNDIVTPLGFGEITSTMVNNYVKKGVIKAPLKKKYRPEQLANILVIAMLKPVFALDAIAAGIQFSLEQANSDFSDGLTISRVNKPDMTTTQHGIVTMAINAVLQKLLVEKMIDLAADDSEKKGKK